MPYLPSARRAICGFFLLALPAVGYADVRLPGIFGEHMVLQRGLKLPVWGWASPGEKVTVNFGGKTASTSTGADGTWQLELPPFPASDQPQTFTVAGKNKITFTDVLVGDVWIASGQSNMEFGIQTDENAKQAIAGAKDSSLRLFFVPWATALDPQKDIAPTPANSLNGKWQVCSPELLAANWAWNGFSAVGYYFARDLRKATGRPVGMIASFKGGTPAEAWTSLSGLKKDPALAHHVADHEKIVSEYAANQAAFPKLQQEFLAAMKEWNAKYEQPLKEAEDQWKIAADQAKAAGRPAPPKPQPPQPRPPAPKPADGGFGAPGNLFNALIAPLIPYAINGVIWYQGESNGDNLAEAVEYATLFPRMITDWREKWGEGDFPFLFVQLANFKPAPKTPSEGNWPWVREAQLKTLALPNTGMASAVDVGNPDNIHPASKFNVGQRLALAARGVAYHEKIVDSGPLYESMTVEGNSIRVKFRETGGGLKLGVPPWTPDGTTPQVSKELKGFGIAGSDQKFVWANARIDGDTVVVSSPEVASPVAVRFGWADNPGGNLYNSAGLPASPFRTDSWPAPLP
jgi:sialate O-acetylesterase